ncbi:MAG: aminopeptidase P family protein [Chloroflexi bacterium]|nr:aminopeptidase P family protein [Chloroflexota bacterium]
MSIGYGAGGVDWRDTIDYGRMRKERLARTQAALRGAGVAAAVLTRGENIRYATGLKGPDFAPQLRYALVFAQGDPIVFELGNLRERQQGQASWIPAENWRFAYCALNGIGGREATRREAQRFADAIVRELRERGVAGEKLGLDALDEASRQALVERGVEVAGVGQALVDARGTKTPDEVNCIRVAIAIANVGYARVYETLKPGRRERDVGAAAFEAMLAAGAEYVSGAVKSGPNTFELNHNGNTDRMIEVGDLVYMNTCRTGYNGYHVCIYRNYIVGRRPNAKEKDWYRRCYERVYGMIGEIKPGATTADAARHLLPASTWGYEAEQELLIGEFGHGYGMTYEPPVISRVFSFDYPQVFEPGQVIAVECREGERGYGGVRLEEMVLVTEAGHEVLTTWPADELVQVGAVV